MPELLTAKDVELKIFRKASFGGYAISDVEDFLNQVAEDLEAYVMRLNDQQRKILDLEEALKKHEAMKDTIKDALILAQKSAKDKEDEARHQAELIIAKAESKMGEINAEVRRRLNEAEAAADDVVAAARANAAQIIKNAEEIKEEAQKRLTNADNEVEQRMNEAKERASEITTTARIEARRITGRIKHEIEESKRELSVAQMERLRFLEESAELAAAFERLVEDARQKLDKALPKLEAVDSRQEKAPLSFYPVSENGEGDQVPASL
ncbi:MAG: DivIVA domain-containing protein [Synergistaceae bacterium]|jgi:cell division initiation protein|nr:DivIVA domain-containing protein [Synergistaceae bacterium]